MTYEDSFLVAALSAMDHDDDLPQDLLPLYISDTAAIMAHRSSDMAGSNCWN
jgi:hypothetical protein